MLSSEIKTLIESALPGSDVIINSNDNIHFDAVVTNPAFIDKTRVQQQQMVYQVLQKYFASGELHALALKTFAPKE